MILSPRCLTLGEYTAQYSEDYRMPLPGISQFLELFNKKDDTPPPAPAKEEVNLYERVLFLHFDSDLP